MNPTSEILERVNKSSSEHHDGVFTRLFRYLLREDIYFAAYQKLYANSGAMTPGSDNDCPLPGKIDTKKHTKVE